MKGQNMQAILFILSIVERLVGFARSQREVERREGRLTPEQDKELDARFERLFESDAWKTDEELDARGGGQ